MAIEQVTFKIDDSNDEFINDAVESNINKLDGIEDLEMDAGIGIVKIKIDTEKVSKSDIELAAAEIGFKITFL